MMINFSNVGLIKALRYKLIKLLAGKAVVIINAHIELVPQRGHFVTLNNNVRHGFLCVNTHIEVGNKHIEIGLNNGESLEM